ncbi:uncharacterized protein METZ01_LOCUS108211 [marine metagenome]|uniref:Uncharacterized protein n=1 Tax=marine metagenome TaxID=408172 RepID=A0A381WTW1_9ZZZZ
MEYLFLLAAHIKLIYFCFNKIVYATQPKLVLA